jgi:hypothetical protein
MLAEKLTVFYDVVIKPRLGSLLLEKIAEMFRKAGGLLGTPESLGAFVRAVARSSRARSDKRRHRLHNGGRDDTNTA